MKDKIKCWVSYRDEFPSGLVFENRQDALEDSAEARACGLPAYVRVKYFTREQFDKIPEAD